MSALVGEPAPAAAWPWWALCLWQLAGSTASGAISATVGAFSGIKAALDYKDVRNARLLEMQIKDREMNLKEKKQTQELAQEMLNIQQEARKAQAEREDKQRAAIRDTAMSFLCWLWTTVGQHLSWQQQVVLFAVVFAVAGLVMAVRVLFFFRVRM